MFLVIASILNGVWGFILTHNKATIDGIFSNGCHP